MRGLFRFEENYSYKMPVHFGGVPFYPVRTTHHDMTCICASYETEMEALARFVPEDFEILEPVVNVQFANSRDVEWMSGGEYRLIQLSAPARYEGNDEGLTGEYILVIWENKTCPIIGGREEDGMPKIFADIACERHAGDKWFTHAAYECSTFLYLELDRGRELFGREIQDMNKGGATNMFGWRFIPNLGQGGAALSHASLYPQEATVSRGWVGEGSIKWTVPAPEHHPQQYGIIASLAGLPVVRYRDGVMLKTSHRLNVGDSRILP